MRQLNIKLFIILSLILGNVMSQSNINQEASKIDFKVKNLGITVDGKMTGITGNINFVEASINNSKFNIQFPVKGIQTGNNARDKHLQEEDFFDGENHPSITFTSKSFTENKGIYIVTGDLTIKGITKETRIPFKYDGKSFNGIFKINRLDFNVGGNGLLNTIGDTVTVFFNCIVE